MTQFSVTVISETVSELKTEVDFGERCVSSAQKRKTRREARFECLRRAGLSARSA